MFARNSGGGQPGTLSGDGPGARDRGNAIIGHRLPAGVMFVHAPLEPCELCDRIAGQVKS